MLQRSSSIPLIGSLIFPFSDSPNKGFSEFNQQSGSFRLERFRRAKSEGNLERLDYSSGDIALFLDSRTTKRSFHRDYTTMLPSAPSFSIFNEGLEDGGVGEEALERTASVGESFDAMGNADFSFRKKCMELIQEGEEQQGEERSNWIRSSYNEEEVELQPPSPPMYLAAGLGIDGVGFATADGVDLSSIDLVEAGDREEFHKRLLDEYPCHPLFLRNYAKFLKSKGDLQGAEDYYHRATLADPEDGEILLQYGKIVWDLHQDKDRALSYFERAVQASPQDSNVLGAYASFLWEIGVDDAEEHGEQQEYDKVKLNLLKFGFEYQIQVKDETEPACLSLDLPTQNPAGFEVQTDIQDVHDEDYYKRMVQENPCNPLVLSNYARFLHQSKGDLEGAEEYYLKAIEADHGDGEAMSQYAKLVWDLHHDHAKASHYFEQAVEATPENSHVLAAYASFLWETEEEEDNRNTSR